MRGLWKPLVEAFDANFGLPEQYADILHERFGDIVPKAKRYYAVPTVTGFRQVFFSEPGQENCMAVIGVLYDTLLKISTLESNSEAELSRIMSVLGDPSRFNIVLRLAKQKSYGRELAKLLNITRARCLNISASL